MQNEGEALIAFPEAPSFCIRQSAYMRLALTLYLAGVMVALAACGPESRGKERDYGIDALMDFNRERYERMFNYNFVNGLTLIPDSAKVVRSLDEALRNPAAARYVELSGSDYDTAFSQLNAIGALENAEYCDFSFVRAANPGAPPFGIRDRPLTNFPPQVFDLEKLRVLLARGVYTDALPAAVGKLTELEILVYWSEKTLWEIPAEIGDLHKLRALSLGNTRIEEMPASMRNLHNLEILRLTGHAMRRLPEWFGELRNLRYLNLDASGLDFAHACRILSRLPRLEILFLENSDIKRFPVEFRRLRNLRELKLRYNYQPDMQNWCATLGSMPNLRVVDASFCRIDSIPPAVARLQNVEYLYLGNYVERADVEWEYPLPHNSFIYLPDSIAALTELKELHLYRNIVDAEYMRHLQKLLPQCRIVADAIHSSPRRSR